MNGVFLDTVGIVALWNRRDQWHVAAQGAFKLLSAERARCFTTNYVVAECANALARLPARHHLANLVEGLEGDGGLLMLDETDWREAWGRFVKEPLGTPGLVDLLSFAAMRQLGLQRVFTNDRHFNTAGFTTLF